jgi:hypothetical protein
VLEARTAPSATLRGDGLSGFRGSLVAGRSFGRTSAPPVPPPEKSMAGACRFSSSAMRGAASKKLKPQRRALSVSAVLLSALSAAQRAVFPVHNVHTSVPAARLGVFQVDLGTHKARMGAQRARFPAHDALFPAHRALRPAYGARVPAQDAALTRLERVATAHNVVLS